MMAETQQQLQRNIDTMVQWCMCYGSTAATVTYIEIVYWEKCKILDLEF